MSITAENAAKVLSPAEIGALSLKLEKVKNPALRMGYHLFLAMQQDEKEKISSSSDASHVKAFLKSEDFNDLSASTKDLIEAIAQDFQEEQRSVLALGLAALPKRDNGEKPEEEEQRLLEEQKSLEAQLLGDSGSLNNYLIAHPVMAQHLNNRLKALENNKAKAKWWMEWVAEPLREESFIGGLMKTMAQWPEPIGAIFDQLDKTCDSVHQFAKLKAMEYDPDLAGALELDRKKDILRGVASGIGAVGNAVALAGIVATGIALAPITAAIAGFGIAISQTISVGLNARLLWKEWDVAESKRYPGRRWELFANVLKSTGKALAGFAVAIAAVAATTVGLPVLAAIGATGLFASSVISAITDGLKLFREWKALPGETDEATRERRLSNASSFVNRLGVIVLTGVIAAAAILLLANPIGLAAVAGAFITAGIVAAAVSFASYLAPKLPNLFERISKWWKGEGAEEKNKLSDKEHNQREIAPNLKAENPDENAEQARASQDLVNRLKQEEAALKKLDKTDEDKLLEDKNHTFLPEEKLFIQQKEAGNPELRNLGISDKKPGQDVEKIIPEKNIPDKNASAEPSSESANSPPTKHLKPGHHHKED